MDALTSVVCVPVDIVTIIVLAVLKLALVVKVSLAPAVVEKVSKTHLRVEPNSAGYHVVTNRLPLLQLSLLQL